MKGAFVAIHGHFYQPPRENPWLNAIEQEESASPFHDWNERIAFECYQPNAYARIVDGQGKILDLFNNYSFLSFNFGPTLLSWIEREKPLVYQKILGADRESLKRLGHGNAIAQVYDHLIMPLAHERDQETEVRWGIKFFEKHFRREPEAMWLPETAVNYAVLECLIQHGMRYLILSPFQALRVKPFSSRKWTDVSQGKVDPTQPYRCFLKDRSGKKVAEKYMDIFFYDGVLSKEIAFGDLLKDGDHLCLKMAQAYQPSKKTPQLIHLSTDGETYGHHKKFGEMALAYAFNRGIARHGLTLINYGAFLEKHPPICEVEVDEGARGEGSAWSCSHGVGRWKEDCGCSTGGQPGWNQAWRAPLREGLNLLRDDLATLFENEGEKIFHDPWEARNGYIDVILDRSFESLKRFFEKYGRPGLDEQGKVKGIKLLEMQRHGLRMFTSCGWFFADLSGIETILILEHAARAIEIARAFSDQAMEQRFLETLSQAQSNLPEMGDGGQIYRRMVKSKQVSFEQVVHHHAISSFLEGEAKDGKLFSYRIEMVDQERVEREDETLFLGSVKVISDPIPESKEFLFGLMSSQESLAQTWISEANESLDFNTLRQRVIDGFEKGEKASRDLLTSLLGNRIFTIRDRLRAGRKEFFQKLIHREVGEPIHIYEEIFNRTKSVLEILSEEGEEIPREIRVAAEMALSHRLTLEVKELKKDFKSAIAKGAIDRIVEASRRYGCPLSTEEPLSILNEILRAKMASFRNITFSEVPIQEALIEEILVLLNSAKRWGLALDLWESQNLMDEILDEAIKNVEESSWGYGVPKPVPSNLVILAERLGFNIEKISKATGFKK